MKQVTCSPLCFCELFLVINSEHVERRAMWSSSLQDHLYNKLVPGEIKRK